MNHHMNMPAEAAELPNPFRHVRERLNLTEKELAERLGSSFYAVVRWERGDSMPPEDIITAFDAMMPPKGTQKTSSNVLPPPSMMFASTGARKKGSPLPPFDSEKTDLLTRSGATYWAISLMMSFGPMAKYH